MPNIIVYYFAKTALLRKLCIAQYYSSKCEFYYFCFQLSKLFVTFVKTQKKKTKPR